LAIAMTHSQHVYEVRPRKDRRGFTLIADVLHSVGCGMAILTLSPTQSDTQSIAADHMRL